MCLPPIIVDRGIVWEHHLIVNDQQLDHTRSMTDFTVDDHGSIVLLRPETRQAWTWVRDNLGERVPAFSTVAGAIAIERQYVVTVLQGLTKDALTWETPDLTIH